MSLRHTTNPAVRVGCCVVAFAALLAVGSARADGHGLADLRVQLLPASGAGAFASHPLVLVGKAALHCAPTIARADVDGNDIDVVLATPTGGCDAKRSAGFALRVVPPSAAELPVLAGQVYRVRVFAGQADAADLVAFHLVDTHAADAPAPLPENGFWWSEASSETGPAAAANGAGIEVQNGQLAISLLGFGDTGAATWYFGSGQQSGRVARVDLVEPANGDTAFVAGGTQPTAQPGPRLEIEFVSPSRARAYVVRSESGRDLDVRALSLARSRFSQGPIGATWAGQWVLVPDEGMPRVFEFADATSQDAETFHLADAQNDATLDCRLASAARHPEVCTLSLNAVPLADFDQVGMDHLSGRGSDGGHVKMLRVQR